MDVSEKQEILDLLDDGRDAFLLAVADAAEDFARARPGINRWSILECVEHVAVAEEYMLSQINKARYSKVPLINSALEFTIKTKGADRTKPIASPDVGKPHGRWTSVSDGLEHFQVCRTRTIRLVQGCTDDLRHMLTDHAIIVGPVNCHEMLLLMAVHPARHAKQVHEIRNAVSR
jgi:hypothetical protein